MSPSLDWVPSSLNESLQVWMSSFKLINFWHCKSIFLNSWKMGFYLGLVIANNHVWVYVCMYVFAQWLLGLGKIFRILKNGQKWSDLDETRRLGSFLTTEKSCEVGFCVSGHRSVISRYGSWKPLKGRWGRTNLPIGLKFDVGDPWRKVFHHAEFGGISSFPCVFRKTFWPVSA